MCVNKVTTGPVSESLCPKKNLTLCRAAKIIMHRQSERGHDGLKMKIDQRSTNIKNGKVDYCISIVT